MADDVHLNVAPSLKVRLCKRRSSLAKRNLGTKLWGGEYFKHKASLFFSQIAQLMDGGTIKDTV